MQNLGKCLGYVAEPCPNCGRVRVEAYSGGKHICEKCSWCVEDEEYFDWDRYDEEREPNHNYNWDSYYK